jgi:hypothetical protein
MNIFSIFATNSRACFLVADATTHAVPGYKTHLVAANNEVVQVLEIPLHPMKHTHAESNIEHINISWNSLSLIPKYSFINR